jgi:hypothetical protein
MPAVYNAHTPSTRRQLVTVHRVEHVDPGSCCTCTFLVQVLRLREVVDQELLAALLDIYDCSALARRLEDKCAQERASVGGKPGRVHIASMRDIHLLTDSLVKDICGADAVAAEHAKGALVKLRALSAQERLALVSQDFFADKDQVRECSGHRVQSCCLINNTALHARHSVLFRTDLGWTCADGEDVGGSAVEPRSGAHDARPSIRAHSPKEPHNSWAGRDEARRRP